MQAHACSRCSALCILYCVKAKEVWSFDAANQKQVEFVSAKTASWSCNNDSLANFAMPTDFLFFFCLHPEATCEFIPIQRVNGSVPLDRSSRAAYHMLAEGVCTALYMNATGRLRTANHMLAEGVCTASYVKLNLAVRQPSLAQQRRAFSHFSPSMTTLPA